MDLDDRALGNAGLWWIGRLQTDADRARVIDGITGGGGDRAESQRLANTIGRLAPRWFVMRDAHAAGPPVLMQPRWAMALMREPMTRGEPRAATAERERRSGSGSGSGFRALHARSCDSERMGETEDSREATPGDGEATWR